VFGRRSSEQSAAAVGTDSAAKSDGKGRPTPTRKEAEEARKQRLTSSRDRKGSAATRRQRATEQRLKVRQAMESGDERYLPERDRGPVKKFIRNYVDSHRSIGEYLLVVFFVFILLSWTVPALATATPIVFAIILILMAVDSVRLVRGVKAQIRERFGDDQTKGVTMYTCMRAWQMRRLRLPKPQVKHGDPV
jgi:Flp pilus assembly protein TadB